MRRWGKHKLQCTFFWTKRQAMRRGRKIILVDPNSPHCICPFVQDAWQRRNLFPRITRVQEYQKMNCDLENNNSHGFFPCLHVVRLVCSLIVEQNVFFIICIISMQFSLISVRFLHSWKKPTQIWGFMSNLASVAPF